MPMAIKKLSIAWDYNTLWYTCICSRTYWPQLQTFSKKDFVYLEHKMPTILDIKEESTILPINDVLSNSILLVEEKNG